MITDIEKALITRFLSSQDTVNAVRNAILEEIQGETNQNLDKTNEEIGAEYRARERARDMINGAFSAIYKVILGKKFGPKAAWLLLDENKQEHLLKLMAAARKYDKG